MSLHNSANVFRQGDFVIETFKRYNDNGQREKVTRKYTASDPTGLVLRLKRTHKLLKPFGKNSGTNNFQTSATAVSSDDVYIEAPNAKQVDIVDVLKKNMALHKTKRTRPALQVKRGVYRHPNRDSPEKASPWEEMEPVTQLRITNLTTDATESDLSDLLGHFGRMTRVFIVKDHVTRQSRGFAFVTFLKRKDAEMALETLNGHPYGYLILKVEWAKPRKQSQAHYSGYGKALPQTTTKK